MTFNVTITASSCDIDSVRNSSFAIIIPGYGNVEVDFEGICSCECTTMNVSKINLLLNWVNSLYIKMAVLLCVCIFKYVCMHE